MEYSLILSVKNLGKRKGKTLHSQLYSDNMPISPVEGNGLLISSNLIQPFFLLLLNHAVPPSDSTLWHTLDRATQSLTGQPFISEEPVHLDAAWKYVVKANDIQLIFKEIQALIYATNVWLSPSRVSHDIGTATSNATTSPITGDSITGTFDFRGKTMKRNSGIPAIDFDFPMPFTSGYIHFHTFASYCLNTRSKQVVIAPAIKDDELVKTYQAKGLLPLAWMEIWYALEHEIKAKVCPYCAKVFVPSPFHPNTRHCQSPECKQQRRIAQKGGIEKYREWERTRKRKRQKDDQ